MKGGSLSTRKEACYCYLLFAKMDLTECLEMVFCIFFCKIRKSLECIGDEREPKEFHLSVEPNLEPSLLAMHDNRREHYRKGLLGG